MHGVVDGVQVVLLGQLGQLELAQGGAVLGLDPHLQVLLGGVGHHIAQQLSKLGSVLGLFQSGPAPILTNLGIALTICHAGHGQIHADLSALAGEVGVQTVDDLLLDLGGNRLAEGLAHADHMLGSPAQLTLLLGELGGGNTALGALLGGILTLINITADRADPLLHSKCPPFILIFFESLFSSVPLGQFEYNRIF